MCFFIEDVIIKMVVSSGSAPVVVRGSVQQEEAECSGEVVAGGQPGPEVQGTQGTRGQRRQAHTLM